jgi:hypothetical protein
MSVFINPLTGRSIKQGSKTYANLIKSGRVIEYRDPAGNVYDIKKADITEAPTLIPGDVEFVRPLILTVARSYVPPRY